MGMMIVRHKIRDYGQWLPSSMGMPKCRGQRGLSIHEFTIPPTATKAPTFSTNDSGTFKRAVDMTDDELAAIVAKAKLTVVK